MASDKKINKIKLICKVKILHIFVVLSLSLGLRAQDELVIPDTDTITLEYRAGGVELDSADLVGFHDYNLRPGGGLGDLFEMNIADRLIESIGHFNYLRPQSRTKSFRTSLPYLGFNYSFGTNATQNVNLDYSHTFNENSRLNFRYHRRTSNGFLRNDSYKLNDVNLLYQRVSNSYSTNFNAYFSDDSYGENGGIQTDTLLQDFDVIFTPVRKGNANSSVKRADFDWSNYFSFNNDSIVHFGLVQRSKFELINRVYLEDSDTLQQLYNNTFIDTISTRDQYQTASITNGLGYFFSTPYFQIDALINHRYWRNQNLGNSRDTNELTLSSKLFVQLNVVELRNEFQLNLLGALGELENLAQIKLPIRDFSFNGSVLFKNKLPEPYQRESFGNHYQWKLSELNTQQTIGMNAGIELNKAFKVGARFKSTTVSNGLYFINDSWRQDTLDVINVSLFEIYGGFHLNKIHIYPKVVLRLNSSNYAFQPKFEGLSRFVYKTGVFKAKKLILSFGVDLRYRTEYTSLSYLPNLGVLQIKENNFVSGNLLNLDAFFGMRIDQFRFYTSVDNISNAWNDQTTRIDPSYPILPLFVRLGVSWDFFN